MFWFSMGITLYMLAGLIIAKQTIDVLDEVIVKHENGFPLTNAENELLYTLDKMNQISENAVLVIYVLSVLFWLPIMIHVYIIK